MTQHRRNDAHRGDASGEPRGFGDEQGTRVGRPTAPPPDEPGHDLAHLGANGEAPEEGRPVRSDTKGKGRDVPHGATGAGDQAAEGMNAVGGRSPHDRSAVDDRPEGRGRDQSGIERSGSEPLRDRDESIAEDYGGKGGKPREDIDVRHEIHEAKETEEVHEPHHGQGWERSSVTGNRPDLRDEDEEKRKH